MGAEPTPLPLVGEVIVSQLVALLVAVHAQPAPAVKDSAPLLTCSLTVSLVLLREKPQLDGFGAWVTVNAWPLTVIVPTRCGPLFAATE